LSERNLDEGAAAALLGHMVGHIQYMELQLRSDPARPTLINTQYSPWNWGHSNPESARPASLEDSTAGFDAHLAASRDLFTMWVKDIPARVFGGLPKNFAIPAMQPPSATAGAWFVPVSWELQDGQARYYVMS
jgi:hypothetical protein